MSKALLILILTLTSGVAVAQMPGEPGMPSPAREYLQLVRYLGLDAKQSTELVRLNLEFQRYLATKTQRVLMVEAELRAETLKDVVDPLALGVRYAELEAICREARDTEKKTQEDARKLLTAAQLAKLQALEQAYTLLPIISEADAAHLMNAPLPGSRMTFGVFNSVSMADPLSAPGCRYSPATVGIVPIRTQPVFGGQ